MTTLILFACLIPTLVEVWLDRKGEDRTGKGKDLFWLSLSSFAFSLGVWWFLEINPLKTIVLILGWRVLVFDYLVTYLLIKNDVISPTAKWWNYSGRTAKWDKLISKVNWRLRLVGRVVVFGVSSWIYFK